MRPQLHSLPLIFFLLTVISVASASRALAGVASAPLTVTATVIARCQLSTVEGILNQDISTKTGSPLNILCPKQITPWVRVNDNLFDRAKSEIRAQSDHNKQPPTPLPTTNQGIYSDNLIITVNF
jgi:spore coat protein U-like protein